MDFQIMLQPQCSLHCSERKRVVGAVYTVSSESVLSPYIPFSTTHIKVYEHIEIPFDISVLLTDQLKELKVQHLQALKDKLPDSGVEESLRKKITKLHATFLFCLTELGAWLAAKAAELLSCKENYLVFWGQQKDGICEDVVRKFSQDVFQAVNLFVPKVAIGDDLKADVEAGLLAAKVCCLVQSLLEYRDACGLRCIVFVERVITAIVVQSLLSNVKQLSTLGTRYMAGKSSGLQSQSRKEQMEIVDEFHEGKVNIIVATQILEEGLDVQSCNLVIRLDPSPNVCSFIQSRGRARTKDSKYVLIVRSGDTATLSEVSSFLKSGDVMREESMKLVSIPCEPLQSDMFDEEAYCVESTGAIVTLNSSVALIYFYCSSLPSDGYFKTSPRFSFYKDTGKCTLNLPKSSPVQMVHAEGNSNVVKQIVCLEACKKLHKIGALTDNLLPAYDMETDFSAEKDGVDTNKNEQADYFPGELVDSWSSFCRRGLYYCYKIALTQSFKYDSSFIDLILVVKATLGSDIISYSYNLETERGSISVSVEYVGVVHLSSEQVMIAKRFQMNVLNMLLHHDTKFMEKISCLQGEQTSLAVAYLLMPSVGGKINWQCVGSSTFWMDKSKPAKTSCLLTETCHLVPTMDGPVCCCILKNSLVYTPHNGKFYCISGNFDFDANSSFTLRDGEVLSYKKYYHSRHGIHLIHENESLLAGRHLFKVQNFLLKQACQNKKGSSSAGVELPPEICMVIMSPISVDTLYTFCFAPAIMHRIQCFLLAVCLKENHLSHCNLSHAVPAVKVLEAITTKKCLEEFSLESLETLGDSFLKYAACQHLYRSYPYQHEGILSSKKDRLISNASLCRLGCRHNIAGFIRTEAFIPKDWIVPGSCVGYSVIDGTYSASSERIYIKGTRYIKSKIIADSVEALIGAYLVAAGEPAAFAFLNILGMEIVLPMNILGKQVLEIPEMYINVNYLESLLKYSFKCPSLLVEALTHGSYQLPDVPGCYQRLEFLGDAVLDHVITLYLYSEYIGITPGLLTDLRSASVNNDCYARAAIKAGLHKHILHASSLLHKQLSLYFYNSEHSFSGSSYGWESDTALPKVLGDIIESIAGAIYIDSGCDKQVVWECISPLLKPLVSPETIEYHPVRELEELCSRESYTKNYLLSKLDGVTSMTIEVEADGTHYRSTRTGPNKKMTKKLAAKAVLEAIKAQ